MGWNGSDVISDNGRASTPQSRPSSCAPHPYLRGIVAGLIVVALACGAFFYILGDKRNSPTQKEAKKSVAIKEVNAATAKKKQAEKNEKKNAKDIAKEFNAQIKEFIKAKPTNETHWIIKPLDPNDPDNALRTRVVQELGSLLSIEPGENMPPFPYSFLLEDDMKAAKERGEDVGEIENGNKAFLDGLKKWKITAKETDSESRLAHKERLLMAQQELMAGMDEGISVNDSIRAAYEFRKRAYELRQESINVIKEFDTEEGSTSADTLAFFNEVNKKLQDEGIKKISLGEIGYEESEE